MRIKSDFTPTSQFGVGILSAFMIGNKIDITTVTNQSNTGSSSLRFSIDGPHEQFYYMKPDDLDLERIGPHGTMVKVILKPEEALIIENDWLEQEEFFWYMHSKRKKRSYANYTFPETWRNSLYSKISHYVVVPGKV